MNWFTCPLILILTLFSAGVGAQSMVIPPEGWEPTPSPQASEWAEPGGKMRIAASQFPKSFNYYLDTTVTSSSIFSYLYDTLLTSNGLTMKPEPSLAEKVEVSEDKKTFTVYLDPDAKWSDGKPITAEDVIWTYDAILKDEHLTGPHKVGLQRFDRPEKLDERTIRFVAKQVHWLNLREIGGMQVLPSHWWKDQEFNEVNYVFPVVSGSHRIKHLNEPDLLVLERREEYWAADDPRSEGLGNVDELEFFFFPDQNLSFDNFRAGKFDVFAVYRARRWSKETQSEAFQKNWIVRQGIHNDNPIGFQGFAMNMRREPFDDLRVRKALGHLLDRRRMNATIMFNQYAMTPSYFPDLYPEGNPNPLVEFNVEKARALLEEAGWKANENGKLEKDGTLFEIKFLTRAASSDQFLIIYREALEQVGIELSIVRKDWASWTEDMDNHNYDMTWAAWGGSVFRDPEAMWSSEFKNQKSGINITGFGNEKVDALIKQSKTEFDIEKRTQLLKEIDAILVQEMPYILLWHIDYVRLLYWNKFGTPDAVLTRYGDERSTQGLWWIDLDMSDDLEAAKENGEKLPPRPADVYFHKIFDGPTLTEPMQ